MQLGTILKEIRVSKDIRQNDVQEKTGISQPYLSQIEGNKKNVSPEVLKKLCKLYKVPPQIVVWKSIEDKDVPKEKAKLYNKLKPVIDKLISEFLK